jgi:sortase (surface protein transpeptidase)
MTAGAPSTRGESRPVPRPVPAIVATIVAVIALAQALAGCASPAAGATPARHSSPSTPHPTVTSTPSAADAASRFRSPRTVAAVPVPVRLRIPSIGVNAGLEQVGLAADGTIAAPRGYHTAAWYKDGPRPGQPGPAVLLGHVDTKHAPAVFYELATLKPGAEVLVDRADKSTVRFRVSGRIQVAKSRFPADLVYAPTLAPILRLVTCGGEFDLKTGHYRDNIVVTALPEVSSP